MSERSKTVSIQWSNWLNVNLPHSENWWKFQTRPTKNGTTVHLKAAWVNLKKFELTEMWSWMEKDYRSPKLEPKSWGSGFHTCQNLIKQKDGWIGRYSEPPDDPYYRLRPVHTRLYVRVRETGDWDLFQACGKWRVFSPGAAACHSQWVSQNGLSRLKSIFSSNVRIELAQKKEEGEKVGFRENLDSAWSLTSCEWRLAAPGQNPSAGRALSPLEWVRAETCRADRGEF